jgi:hypothetical protein
MNAQLRRHRTAGHRPIVTDHPGCNPSTSGQPRSSPNPACSSWSAMATRSTPGPMQSDTSGALRTCHSPAGCSNASHGLGESLAAECWGQRTSPPEAADLPHTAGSGPHRTTAPTTLRPMQIRRSGACVVLDRWGLGGGSALSGATHLWGPARWSLAVLVRIKPRARLWGAVRLRLGGATVWWPRFGGDRRMFDGASGKHRVDRC